MVLDSDRSCLENEATGEHMDPRMKGRTHIVEAQFGMGDEGAIKLDSGPGVRVWPENWPRKCPR